MSGGVDSSVSVALLKAQGFDVTGVFIKVWQPDWMECSWREDRLDAMRVAVHLGIPFVTLDLEKEYKKEVVDYMISEYRVGNTPNPDVMCNRYVKFGGFFDWAMKQGADFVATGHYAQIHEKGGDNGTKQYELVSGIDQGKDQSYFLWTLTERELSKTIFPVGGFEKLETRKLAKKFGLPVAEKRDSQGLCFIGKVDIKEFLSHYIEPVKGDVLDEQGNIIGSHDGALFLTLGERHGFSVSQKVSDGKPYYVVSRDLKKNTVTVSNIPQDITKLSSRKEYEIASVHWIGEAPRENVAYKARIRHLGEFIPCKVKVSGTKTKIVFDEDVSVASGQSIVVYDSSVCMGGGVVV